ncbi:MAG: toprim domain-containing protein [archaeon]
METIAEWADALDRSATAIVVEGKNDEAALRALGVRNKIFQLTGNALFEAVEDVVAEEKEVVILTDLDREGKKLYRVLLRDLSERGVRIDRQFREWLFGNTRIAVIEGLKRKD